MLMKISIRTYASLLLLKPVIFLLFGITFLFAIYLLSHDSQHISAYLKTCKNDKEFFAQGKGQADFDVSECTMVDLETGVEFNAVFHSIKGRVTIHDPTNVQLNKITNRITGAVRYQLREPKN